MKEENRNASDCIHCHICRNHCPFLKKYQIDIGDMAKLNELAYHCFLCGKCTEVCPRNIDGREMILQMRRELVLKSGGNLPEKGYNMLFLEKKNYLFKNYRHAVSGSVLFTGCNFPSFYPGTTKKLVQVLKEKAGIGVIYDCCGKPVSELGIEKQEKIIISHLEERLKKEDISELIMLCPNCYEYLKDRMNIRIVSIYEKLKELRIGRKMTGGGFIFPPCPDREKLEWLIQIEPFFENKCKVITEVNCCGLGGCAGVKEPELATGFADKLCDRKYEKIYTYCGSCAGSLTRNGCNNVHHILTEIMGTRELPDIKKSMVNRIKTKFI